jgi:glyoxalase family protein
MTPLRGIHHVTAITGDAQKNADFYTGVLGLRLVKKTVNFDDPGSYHLYYGDHTGSPGTLVTFFEWPGATPGKAGAGEPVAIVYAVPAGSIGWWAEHLADYGAKLSGGRLTVRDPDGMRVELVETPGEAETLHAIKHIEAIVLSLGVPERSHALYTDELGFSEEISGNGKHYKVGESFVDVETPAGSVRGRIGAGSIHHVAFRVDDDTAQGKWLQKLHALGLNVSPVMDRKYFHSIYFRERNGVLFELATDGPGMHVDEPVEHLGETLALPAEYESMRTVLEQSLQPITVGRTLVHA